MPVAHPRAAEDAVEFRGASAVLRRASENNWRLPACLTAAPSPDCRNAPASAPVDIVGAAAFPKTAIEFDRRFATEKACIDYWMQAQWSGEPRCARCESARLRIEQERWRFECAACVRPPDVADVWHCARRHAQTLQGMVPRGVRRLVAPRWHLGEGIATHPRLRLLRDGMDVAAHDPWLARPDRTREARRQR